MFDSARAPNRLNALNARSVFALSKEAEVRILRQIAFSFSETLYKL